MIYSISGRLALKESGFAVVETGGLGLKLFASRLTLEGLPAAGTEVKFFCHLHVREDALDLFGFTSEGELQFFEMLISVSGVGPKSALAILDTAPLDELSAAIKEGRPDPPYPRGGHRPEDGGARDRGTALEGAVIEVRRGGG